MNIETTYSLDEEDYLEYYLYDVSSARRKKKQSKYSFVWEETVFFLLCCLIIYRATDNIVLLYWLLAATILVVFILPFFANWSEKKYFKKFINKNLKSNFGQIINVIFTDESIETIDYSGESRINISQVREVNEIGRYYFLPLLAGTTFIIPKEKLTNPLEIENAIKYIVSKLGIEHNINLDWKWK
ncbi:MAG: YcxB family protein [Prevotellaceae bacterium]|jgi:hypothetical protein|nr:YcxB family protein [Prevotellaceae bacterium]